MSAIVINNKGNVYKHLGDYEKSIAAFLNAINIGDSLKDLNNLSMYHENLSDAYLQANIFIGRKAWFSFNGVCYTAGY